MEWLIFFSAGVVAGLVVWPLARVAARIPPSARWLGRNAGTARFRSIYGFPPSRDPDVRAVLQHLVDQHLSYLREHARHAERDVARAQGVRPRSLTEARRTVEALRAAKRRLAKVEKRLDDAERVAGAWGFPLMQVVPPSELGASTAEVEAPGEIAAASSDGARRALPTG